MKTTADVNQLDELGRYALRYVKEGQTIGLGTGRAASAFIRALAESKIAVRGVPTSHGSAELARSLKIELVELSDAPKLSADFDGADEVCLEGETGFLVHTGDIAAVAQRLLQLANDAPLRERLGHNGQQFVRENFAVEQMVDNLYHLYLKLAAAAKMTKSK